MGITSECLAGENWLGRGPLLRPGDPLPGFRKSPRALRSPNRSQPGTVDSVSATHLSKGRAMTITVEATYENGVLKPAEPLPLKESQKVRVTVHTQPTDILQAYGIMAWKGDAATVEHFALDPELDPQQES